MISVLLATLIAKLQVRVMYAIFLLNLKILKWDTKPSEGTLRLSWRANQASVALWPGAGSIIEINLPVCSRVCSPHSVLLNPDQRPARASSPGRTLLVQCVQPILG